jgi:hypothetical protein
MKYRKGKDKDQQPSHVSIKIAEPDLIVEDVEIQVKSSAPSSFQVSTTEDEMHEACPEMNILESVRRRMLDSQYNLQIFTFCKRCCGNKQLILRLVTHLRFTLDLMKFIQSAPCYTCYRSDMLIVALKLGQQFKLKCYNAVSHMTFSNRPVKLILRDLRKIDFLTLQLN